MLAGSYSRSGAPHAPIKVVFGLESSKMVHHVRHSRRFSQELTEWCTTCTNQGRFRLGSSQNGAPHAPISADFKWCTIAPIRSFSARKFAKWCIVHHSARSGKSQMVHHVHQSSFSAEFAKWCITCTIQRSGQRTKMVHHVHHSGHSGQEPKWCTTCTNQRRFRPRSSQNGASRAPIKVVFGLESSKTVHHVHQ